MATGAQKRSNAGLGIGDVSKITGIPVHTIRYWEREFSRFLQPSRTVGKQRRYTDEDIRKLLRIKALLWTQRFSIRAAKRICETTPEQPSRYSSHAAAADTSRMLLRLVQVGGKQRIASELV